MSHKKEVMYYRLVAVDRGQGMRMEFHVSKDKKEVEEKKSLCKAIGMTSPKYLEWQDEVYAEVKLYRMVNVEGQ